MRSFTARARAFARALIPACVLGVLAPTAAAQWDDIPHDPLSPVFEDGFQVIHENELRGALQLEDTVELLVRIHRDDVDNDDLSYDDVAKPHHDFFRTLMQRWLPKSLTPGPLWFLYRPPRQHLLRNKRQDYSLPVPCHLCCPGKRQVGRACAKKGPHIRRGHD